MNQLSDYAAPLLTRQVRQLVGRYVAHRTTERLKPMVVGSFLYPDKKNNKNCLFKEPTDLWAQLDGAIRKRLRHRVEKPSLDLQNCSQASDVGSIPIARSSHLASL